MATVNKNRKKKIKAPNEFLSANIGIVLKYLPANYSRGPEYVNRLRAERYKTVGDVDD